MYFPKDIRELGTILEDLQRFAQLEGMHRLSESLADARFEISRADDVSADAADPIDDVAIDPLSIGPAPRSGEPA